MIASTSMAEALVLISKGILKLGKWRTGACVIMSFNVVNACNVSVFHLNYTLAHSRLILRRCKEMRDFMVVAIPEWLAPWRDQV